jgi:hypothetical protein
MDQYYSSDMTLDLLEIHSQLVLTDRKILMDDYRDTTDLEAEAELGHIMLAGYLEWVEDEGIDVELERISNEEIISMPMFDGKVELQGKLDMRVRRKSDGARMFRDFKTVGGSFTEFGSTAHMNEQILTYMTLEAAQNKDGERSDGGIFTMLKKVKRSAAAKPPFYQQIEVRHNIYALRNFWQRLQGSIGDMLNVRKALDEGANHQLVAYPRPSRDCKWKCQFFSVCPLVDDGSAAEAAIEDSFAVGNPYDYYNSTQEKKGSE